MQVRNCIVQKFGLITADAEFNIRIHLPEVIHGTGNGLFHIIHILVRLLDDGKCHDALAVTHGYTRLFGRDNGYLAEVTQADYSFPFTQKDVLHILPGTQQSGEFDIIFVIAIPYRHAAGFHIVASQHVFHIRQRQSQHSQLIRIGHNLQLLLHHTGNIHHRHLGQLFDTTLDDVFSKTAQFKKSTVIPTAVCAIILQRQIQIEYGNIRSTRLHHFGTFGILGEIVHRGINLFIHFDKG